jgi:aspartate aminotransferase
MLEEYRRRRDYVVQRIRSIPGLKMAEPKGAFYAYPNVSAVFGHGGIHSSMDFCEQLLRKAHVAAVPGEAFGTDKHIRISYATSIEELERGLDRIEQFVKSLLG